MEKKKRCFVIMPFSKTTDNHTEEYWSRHFNFYLKPIIEKIKNLEVFRSEPLRGNIATQIITNLFTSEIVVADLTDHNPNVLWELGVRQSFKHSTITIAQTGTQIPFHFSHKGILFYNGEHLDNEVFEQKFHDSLMDCVIHPEEPDSPVLETLGGRGTLYSIIHADENKRKLDSFGAEFYSNKNILERILKLCKDNQDFRKNNERKKCKMESMRFTSFSAEILLATRYLDMDTDFYDAVYTYYADMLACNEILAKWTSASENVEKWLLANNEEQTQVYETVQTYLKKL